MPLIRYGVNTKLPIHSWVNEMGFGTTNIERVWAQVFPAGRLSREEVVALPGLALVGWESRETEKYFQAYGDGRLLDVTDHPQQRMPRHLRANRTLLGSHRRHRAMRTFRRERTA